MFPAAQGCPTSLLTSTVCLSHYRSSVERSLADLGCGTLDLCLLHCKLFGQGLLRLLSSWVAWAACLHILKSEQWCTVPPRKPCAAMPRATTFVSHCFCRAGCLEAGHAGAGRRGHAAPDLVRRQEQQLGSPSKGRHVLLVMQLMSACKGYSFPSGPRTACWCSAAGAAC